MSISAKARAKMKANKALAAAAIALLPLLAYLPALKSELIWDSKPMILENDLLQGEFSLLAPFKSGWWETTSQGGEGGYDYYRPLTVLSFMAEKALWGISPWRMHMVNLLLFLAAILILYRFLRRWQAPPGTAEAAALLFALFPPHLDNINWVVGRCDLLMLLFGLLSLLLFDRFLANRRWQTGALSWLSLALALFAKESALFFLPLFPLLELRRRERISPKLHVSPLLVAGAVWMLKSAAIGRGGFPLRLFPSVWENIETPLAALGYYARSLAFPFAYDMFLPVSAVKSFPYLAAGALFALFLLLAPFLARRQSPLLFSWSWIAPFLGGALLLLFTPIHPFSISSRYLMIPAIGAAWLLALALARLRPPVRRALLAALLVLAVAAIQVHSQKYAGEAAFWKTALASSPGDGFFLNKYARELIAAGDPLQGEVLLRRALNSPMKPSTAFAVALQLADIAFSQARYDESLAWLERLRPLNPGRRETERIHRALLKIHRARNDPRTAAAVLARTGRAPGQDASLLIETALAFADWNQARAAAKTLPPDQAARLQQAVAAEEARFALLAPTERAGYFLSCGNFAAAWDLWPQKEPPDIAGKLQAARLALLAGREQEGQARIRLLAQDHQEDFRVLNSLGNLLFELHRAGQALSFYRRSLRLQPAQPALRERAAWIGARLPPAPGRD